MSPAWPLVSPPQYEDHKFSWQMSKVYKKIKHFQIDEFVVVPISSLLYLLVHFVLLEQNMRNWVSHKEVVCLAHRSGSIQDHVAAPNEELKWAQSTADRFIWREHLQESPVGVRGRKGKETGGEGAGRWGGRG